jgi:hypothetical protein
VILITLRPRTELRLCQVTIIRYTRWPFLSRRSAPALCAINPTNGLLSEGYYEEVRIIPQTSRSESGTLMDVGAGLCRLPEASQPPIPPFICANVISGAFVLPR